MRNWALVLIPRPGLGEPLASGPQWDTKTPFPLDHDHIMAIPIIQIVTITIVFSGLSRRVSRAQVESLASIRVARLASLRQPDFVQGLQFTCKLQLLYAYEHTPIEHRGHSFLATPQKSTLLDPIMVPVEASKAATFPCRR